MGMPTYLTMEQWNTEKGITYAGSFSVAKVPVTTMEDFNKANNFFYVATIVGTATAKTVEDFNRAAGYSNPSSVTW